MAETIVLRKNQIVHVERLEEILSSHFCAFDMSIMGAGKTYTTSSLSIKLGFEHVIVICPATVESKWKSMSNFGVKIDNVISYQSLRSRKGSTPKHGLLDRHDIPTSHSEDKDENEEESTAYFTPTEKLIEIVKEGCLVVFDEAHNFKNKNDQFMACQALTNIILKIGGLSRFILLSGTPFDKEKHVINMLHMMGFIRSAKLYSFTKEDRRLRLYGAQELIDYCKVIDEKGTNDFLKAYPFYQENVQHNCYLMFQKIIKPSITSSMPSPELEINCKNGYYIISREEDRKNLTKAISDLRSSLMFDERRETVNVTKTGFQVIAKTLVKIEKSKIFDMARVAMNTLQEHPNCKVGLFVNYTESVMELKELLSDYNPIVLYGQITKEKRQDLIDKFQERNLNRRLIISNLKVASVGIDLDDKDGNFPRYAFASPNYVILDLHQLTRRFARLDTKSDATFRFFYGNVGKKETSILNALARKTQVLKDTLDEYTGEKIIYPGEYEGEIETEEGVYTKEIIPVKK
jgi:hypothetical protein